MERRAEVQIAPRSKENTQQILNGEAHLGLDQKEGQNLPFDRVKNVTANFGLDQQTRKVGKVNTNLLVKDRNNNLQTVKGETHLEEHQGNQKTFEQWYNDFHKDDEESEKIFNDESDSWLERVENMSENETKSKDQSIFISKKEKHEEGKVVDNTDEILEKAVHEVHERILAMLESGIEIDENSIQVMLSSVLSEKLKAKLANVIMRRVFDRLQVQNLAQLNQKLKLQIEERFIIAINKMCSGKQTSKELTMDSIVKIIEKALAGSLDKTPEGKMKIIYETCKFFNICESVMFKIAEKIFDKDPITQKKMKWEFKKFVLERNSMYASFNRLLFGKYTKQEQEKQKAKGEGESTIIKVEVNKKIKNPTKLPDRGISNLNTINNQKNIEQPSLALYYNSMSNPQGG